MRLSLMASVALGVLTTGALAQSTAPPRPNPPGATADQPGMKPSPPPGPPPEAGMQAPPPGRPDAMGEDDAGGPPPPHRGHGKKSDDEGGPHGRRPPPPSRAAHFRIETGDAVLDITCPDNEPMQGCADLTVRLLDKLQAMPNH